ncbi:MAG: IS5 family transposase [Treponema sp.]|nr:IS5 family transposase [Treponema sp.]
MKPKTPLKQQQANFLYQDLIDQLNPKHPLLLLAKKIPWGLFEDEFKLLYAEIGRPAKSIRLMVGLLLLKQLENLSDERVVEAWLQNPYYQSFCGMKHFQWSFPCNPSELVHFRKRIGESGAEKIFQASVLLHGDRALELAVVIDTTVQEKNITFPTDDKLRMKVIRRCWNLASTEDIQLRRSYRRELKKLLRIIRFSKSVRVKSKVTAAKRRLKTIANALLRDITRKLPEDRRNILWEKLEIYRKAVNQQRKDKNKIYSLHEPEICCICKGKEHKKYEFGSKAAIAMTKTDCIIVGAKSFRNEYDGDTLQGVLSHVSAVRGASPEKAFCDRGFRGRKTEGCTAIIIPQAPSRKTTEYSKRKARRDFGRRSAIEPVIGHVKNDFRLARNYLKGTIGDAINLLLAVAAFNFRKWMRAVIQKMFFVICSLLAVRVTRKDLQYEFV